MLAADSICRLSEEKEEEDAVVVKIAWMGSSPEKSTM
jgi:hypothetical protein